MQQSFAAALYFLYKEHLGPVLWKSVNYILSSQYSRHKTYFPYSELLTSETKCSDKYSAF